MSLSYVRGESAEQYAAREARAIEVFRSEVRGCLSTILRGVKPSRLGTIWKVPATREQAIDELVQRVEHVLQRPTVLRCGEELSGIEDPGERCRRTRLLLIHEWLPKEMSGTESGVLLGRERLIEVRLRDAVSGFRSVGPAARPRGSQLRA